MLEQLHVRNLRGLRDLKIQKFGRVNLLAGKNNVGKTTLLEAIFLLGSGGDCRLALNRHMVRLEPTTEVPTSISETVWASFFFGLETDSRVTISGYHSLVGEMELAVALERSMTSEIPRDGEKGAFMRDRSGERVLKFRYVDPVAGTLESEARETATEIKFEQSNTYVPFNGSILQPRGGNTKNDAILLGQLRRQKRGELLLEALYTVEPRLQGIEDNSSSGAPMIWVDVGLRELVPLPAMGAGMAHVTRIVLAAGRCRAACYWWTRSRTGCTIRSCRTSGGLWGRWSSSSMCRCSQRRTASNAWRQRTKRSVQMAFGCIGSRWTMV